MNASNASPASPGRPLIWAAAAAVGLAFAAIVALLWPVPDRQPQPPLPGATVRTEVPEWAPVEQLVAPEERAPAGPPPDEAPAPVPVDPGQRTVDLFAGPAPELLARGYDVVSSGRRLHSKRVKEIHSFSEEHPDDARPQLLLAMDSMNRGWYGFAANHYARAVRADARAAQDPRVLRDLIHIAGRKHDYEEAQGALRDLYGRAALPALMAALGEAEVAGDAMRSERLSALVDALEGLREAR